MGVVDAFTSWVVGCGVGSSRDGFEPRSIQGPRAMSWAWRFICVFTPQFNGSYFDIVYTNSQLRHCFIVTLSHIALSNSLQSLSRTPNVPPTLRHSLHTHPQSAKLPRGRGLVRFRFGSSSHSYTTWKRKKIFSCSTRDILQIPIIMFVQGSD
jgi:hypothetical protein